MLADTKKTICMIYHPQIVAVFSFHYQMLSKYLAPKDKFHFKEWLWLINAWVDWKFVVYKNNNVIVLCCVKPSPLKHGWIIILVCPGQILNSLWLLIRSVFYPRMQKHGQVSTSKSAISQSLNEWLCRALIYCGLDTNSKILQTSVNLCTL